MVARQYKRKPIVVTAEQWLRPQDNVGGVRSTGYRSDSHCECCGSYMKPHGLAWTKDGSVIVCPGDWILTDDKGVVEVKKPIVFHAEYELI